MFWEMLFVAAALALLAPSLGYPWLARLWPRRPWRTGLARPRVSVVVPAHNEAAVIGDKLGDVLAQSWGCELDVLVGCDGCVDATAHEARRALGGFGRVFEWSARRGKMAVLTDLVAEARGEWVLFTDAGARLPTDLLAQLLPATVDASVGVVCPRYAVGAGAEAGYWAAETDGLAALAERDALLGAHGAAYLVRRSALSLPPADTINDDYVIPLRLRAAGWRVAYVPTAVVREPAATPRTVFHRQTRIARGNLQMLWRHRALCAPRHGPIALTLLTHKLAKTMLPWTALAALVAALAGAFDGWLVAPALTGLLAAAVAGAWRWWGQPPRRVAALGYLVTTAVAYAVGSVEAALGRGAWRRAPENEPLTLGRPPWRVRVAKRGLDVFAAGLALALLWPVMLAVVVAVRLESSGPAVFRQVRMGIDPTGRPCPFTMLKFRSMRQDAEAAGPQWATERDPRVTRVGRFLRKSRLDELPQLVNVLRGEMSLVGPRPERPVFTEALAPAIPGYDDRLVHCKPGITGWAQVHCPYDTSVESVRTKLAYDLAYGAHQHRLGTWLRMEFSVVWRTLWVMAVGKGAR